MSLYVYCLSDELDAAAFEGLTGVGGASVRVLSLGRVAAVVSEFEDESVAVTGENVRAHNRVNSQVLAALTPLPFRFGTRAAESRLAEYVAANEESLVASLARVRGCVEMSVKIRDGASKAKGKRQKAKEESEGAAGESEEEASARVGGMTRRAPRARMRLKVRRAAGPCRRVRRAAERERPFCWRSGARFWATRRRGSGPKRWPRGSRLASRARCATQTCAFVRLSRS